MKAFLRILLLLLFCISVQAQTTTVVTLTVTSAPANGNTISVNGSSRMWTNGVTSASTQIQTTNTIGGSATNLLYACSLYPLTHIYVEQTATNVLVFTADPGQSNTIAITGGWATLSVNIYGGSSSNLTQFRGFASLVGADELTNTANGIESYLASSAVTNAIPTNAPALANYVPYIVFTNQWFQVAENSTNFTLATSNALYAAIVASSNYTTAASNSLYLSIVASSNAAVAEDLALATSITNATNDLNTAISAEILAAWQSATNFTLITSNSLYSLLSGGGGGGGGYLDGSGNVKLVDGNSTTRLEADKSGNFTLSFHDGNNFLSTDGNNDVFLKDHSGANRIEIDDSSVNGGDTIFRSSSGNDDFVIEGNDTLLARKQIIENFSVMPIVVEGTITNYSADQQNSGSTETTVNLYTLPGSVLLTNNDTLRRTIGIKTAANSNSKTVKVYFDGNVAASAATTTSGAFIYITLEVTRDSSSSYRTMASATSGSGTAGGTAGSAFAYVNEVSGEDFTTSKDFKVTLTGTSTGDLTAVLDRIEFAPSSLDH